VFFRATREELVTRYEAMVDPANGYLTDVEAGWLLVDATASETADWRRETDIAIDLSDDGVIALSVFLNGPSWALAVAQDARPGPVAVYDPDDTDVLDALPQKLMDVESALGMLFPDDVDVDEVDAIFGAVLEGVMSPDEGMTELLTMLGCRRDWLRWSWCETIPEQLFTDPDLAHRVTPLGEARQFWEE
jgi:hypothetical protein